MNGRGNKTQRLSDELSNLNGLAGLDNRLAGRSNILVEWNNDLVRCTGRCDGKTGCVFEMPGMYPASK